MYLCTNIPENLKKKKRSFRASKAIDYQMTSLPSLLSVVWREENSASINELKVSSQSKPR